MSAIDQVLSLPKGGGERCPNFEPAQGGGGSAAQIEG